MAILMSKQDVYDRDMTIYDYPGFDARWEARKSWPSPWPELAERVYIFSGMNWFDDFTNIVQNHALEKESIF